MKFYQRHPLFSFLALTLLAGVVLELGAQKTSFYNTRVGINTNDPTYALQIYQPDISRAAIDITYAAGAGNTTALQIHNGTGATNAYIGVGGNAYFAGSIQLGVLTPITPAMFYITNNGSGPIVQIDSIHGASLFQMLTNGNVGIGTNDPKALLHFYSPLTANPKLLQFDDDAHTPRAFAGIFPGGGGFSFFNGAGTNDNARTIGWTAASTIMNAPTTVEFQVGGVAQHRLTLTQFAPVSDNAERLGTSALRYSEGNFVNLTNAGSMSVGGRFGQTNKTLAYAGTTNVFVDGTLGNVFNLTLTANTHLIFTNIQEAYSGWINLVQDGTGSRLLSYNNANVKTNATITASTAAGSVDVLFFATGLIGTNLNIILHTAFK